MSNLTAKDVMNPRVLSVRDDMTLHELATFLTENEISEVPVLESGGKPVGVVSLTDIALSAERASLEREQSGSTFDLTPWKKQFNREDLRVSFRWW